MVQCPQSPLASSASPLASSIRNGFEFPQCPPAVPARFLAYMNAPSSFAILTSHMVLSLLLSVLVLRRYNAVMLPKLKGIFKRRTLSTPSVNNGLWVVYFLCITITALLQMVRLLGWNVVGLWGDEVNERFIFSCKVLVMAMHTITCLVLTMALIHQKKYRSGHDLILQQQRQPDQKTLRAINKVIEVSVENGKSNCSSNSSSSDGNGGADTVAVDPIEIPAAPRGERELSDDSGSDNDQMDQKPINASNTGEEEWFGYRNDVATPPLEQTPLLPASIQTPSAYELIEDKQNLFIRAKYWVLSLEMGAVLLLLVNFVAIVFQAINPWDGAAVYHWILFAASILQHFWLLVVCVFIVFGSSPRGPRMASKVVLIVALCAGFSNYLPLPFWHSFLSPFYVFQGCTFWIMSVYDLLLFCHVVSSVLWCWFVRAEFQRNQAEVFHTVISRTQDLIGKQMPIF